MGVAVHQARAQQGTATVVARKRVEVGGQVGAGTQPGDVPLLHDHAHFTCDGLAAGQRAGQQAHVRPHAVGAGVLCFKFSSTFLY